MLCLGVELFHVEGESVEQDLGENPICVAPLQAAEIAILLEYAEGAFGLDRTVQAQQDTQVAGNERWAIGRIPGQDQMILSSSL